MDTCSTCQFHAGDPDADGRRPCRALPPQFAHETASRLGAKLVAVWPYTSPDDACGGHRPAPAPAPAVEPEQAEQAEQPEQQEPGAPEEPAAETPKPKPKRKP